MADSEQNNDVAPEADEMKSSSGARGFLGVIYKLAVLALLVVFVWEADQIRQELQSGSVNANVGSVYVSGGSLDANVDFPDRQSVYVSGGSVDANVDFPDRQSVYVSGGSVDANVDFPDRQSVYVSGGSVDANVDFPFQQDVNITGTKMGLKLDVQVRNSEKWAIPVYQAF